MKKAGKYIICSILTLGFSACLFFCLVAGAPQLGSGRVIGYVFCALGFSLLNGGLLTWALCQIHTLQKKVEQLQERLKNSTES